MYVERCQLYNVPISSGQIKTLWTTMRCWPIIWSTINMIYTDRYNPPPPLQSTKFLFRIQQIGFFSRKLLVVIIVGCRMTKTKQFYLFKKYFTSIHNTTHPLVWKTPTAIKKVRTFPYFPKITPPLGFHNNLLKFPDLLKMWKVKVNKTPKKSWMCVGNLD